jgi:putative membrane protein
VGTDDRRDLDYRFSLANERTFLAWIRTALALVAGGVAAAKALPFDHEVWRWTIAAPPIVAGAFLALDATVRWRRYEDLMRAGGQLPAGRGLKLVGAGLCAYALVALLVSVLDGA